MSPVPIEKNEFDLITAYVYKECGILLDDSKVGLVEGRLSDLLEQHQCKNFMQLYNSSLRNPKVSTSLIDALTTNETSFFRDSKIFESLLKHLIEGCLDDSSHLHIWSAACSYGQEPYTLAMVLKEMVYDTTKFHLQVTGTDICSQALNHASRGIYSPLEIGRGLSDKRLRQHFNIQENGHYKVEDELRSICHFNAVNLLNKIPMNHNFKIVLCRNVAIYFDVETKKNIFNNIADTMAIGGALIIGSSEMLIGITDRFKRCEWNGIIYYQLTK